MQKKPLYRKLNEVGTYGHLQPLRKYRFDRHKKTPVGSKMRTEQKKVRYDYAPLFRFLLSKVGKPWDPIFQECQSRLDTTTPITFMVVNVNERGLVVDRGYEAYNRFFQYDETYDGMKKSFRYGPDSYWSTLFVDSDGILQFVDETYVEPYHNYYCPWMTQSWNGEPFVPENNSQADES